MDSKTILEDLGIIKNEVKENEIVFDKDFDKIIFVNLDEFYEEEEENENI